MLNRREFIRSGAVAAGTLSFDATFLRGAFARQAKPGPSPYGRLGAADRNGIRLPAGFRSRLIARHSRPVGPTTYELPPFPDGAAIYPQGDGGWIMAVNSEHPLPGRGGASAIRFDRNGDIADAYRILGGTQANCSGGKTPWDTWLSCEEHPRGRVWECDIHGRKPPVELPAMGTRKHEAAWVEPVGKRVYLVEDEPDAGFYRYTPDAYPDLRKGLLEAALVDEHGLVEWREVPDPGARQAPNRKQIPRMARFRRGEGLFIDWPYVFVTTTRDSKIHAYNVVTETIEVLWSGEAVKSSPAEEIDQLAFSDGGEIFVCEDEGELRISILSANGRVMAPFLQLQGPKHVRHAAGGNETSGVVFDPSGTRMYFAAQRSLGGLGGIYEVKGPFRKRKADLREPALRVEAPAKASVGRLKRRGLAVTVVADEPCKVSAKLRAPGKRTFTVARESGELMPGERAKLRLKAGESAVARLDRRRGINGVLVLTATDRRGNKRRVRRELRITR